MFRKLSMAAALIAFVLPATHALAYEVISQGGYYRAGAEGCGFLNRKGDPGYRAGLVGYAGYSGYGYDHPGYAWGPAGWTIICD